GLEEALERLETPRGGADADDVGRLACRGGVGNGRDDLLRLRHGFHLDLVISQPSRRLRSEDGWEARAEGARRATSGMVDVCESERQGATRGLGISGGCAGFLLAVLPPGAVERSLSGALQDSLKV